MLKRAKGNPYLQGFGLAGSPNSDREVSIYTCNQYNTIQRYNKRVLLVGQYAFAFRVVLQFWIQRRAPCDSADEVHADRPHSECSKRCMCPSGDRVTIVTGGPGRWRMVHLFGRHVATLHCCRIRS